MDNSNLTRVMSEMAANCKQQKRKWARAAFVKFFASPEVRSEEVTPVIVSEEVTEVGPVTVEEVAPVMVKVTEELVEAPLAPAWADSLQPVLDEVVVEEAFTPLVLEPNKASVRHCTV